MRRTFFNVALLMVICGTSIDQSVAGHHRRRCNPCNTNYICIPQATCISPQPTSCSQSCVSYPAPEPTRGYLCLKQQLFNMGPGENCMYLAQSYSIPDCVPNMPTCIDGPCGQCDPPNNECDKNCPRCTPITDRLKGLINPIEVNAQHNDDQVAALENTKKAANVDINDRKWVQFRNAANGRLVKARLFSIKPHGMNPTPFYVGYEVNRFSTNANHLNYEGLQTGDAGIRKITVDGHEYEVRVAR